MTGFSLFDFSLGGKWLDLVKEFAPHLERIVFMLNPDTAPYSKFFMPVIESAATSLGVQVIPAPVRAEADIEPALALLVRQPNGGLMLQGDSFTRLHQKLIANLALRFAVPSIASSTDFAKDGGLMDYSPYAGVAEQYRQAAHYVDPILKGAKPADLPVQAGKVQTGSQSQGCQGARPDRPAIAARTRRTRCLSETLSVYGPCCICSGRLLAHSASGGWSTAPRQEFVELRTRLLRWREGLSRTAFDPISALGLAKPSQCSIVARENPRVREMNQLSRRQVLSGVGAAGATMLSAPSVCAQTSQQTLRFIAEADLKVLDPIWTTAYITRNHGYLVYDTLFGTDENQQIQPQMVERNRISPDGMRYVFTLRKGLRWHDGKPVRSEDCVESLKAGQEGSLWPTPLSAYGQDCACRPQYIHTRSRRAVRSSA